MSNNDRSKGNQAIHPMEVWEEANTLYDHKVWKAGLTKREYFAAAALTGLLAANELPLTRAAIRAVEVADTILDELNREDKKTK